MVKEIVKPETVLQCHNSNLNWENMYAGLENIFSGKISSARVRHTAAQIESCFIYQVYGIEASDKEGSDTKQLLLDPECFAMLFQADDDPVGTDCLVAEQIPKPVEESPKRHLGCQPLWLKFPAIVQTASDFIKQHSFSAHQRGCKSTGTGVTLKDLQQHLVDNIPGLKYHRILQDTIHHSMVAPRKNSSRADRYKGHI